MRHMRHELRPQAVLALVLASLGCEAGPIAPSDIDAAAEPSERFDPPKLHIVYGEGLDFDPYWCRGSMIPEQDPIVAEIRRSRFQIDPRTDLVTIPPEWIAETKDVRGPQLRAAAEERVPQLLEETTRLVDRPFRTRDHSYFFYLCPFWDGGTAGAKVFPMFMYLRSAVGEALQWPDWLFTDQYLFHEILHNYVMETVDYSVGTPILNQLYGELLTEQPFIEASQKHLGYPDPITPEYEARWESTRSR